MSRPQTWGDELTLAAASHLLLRPITVLADEELESERRFTSPPVIAEECWGHEIYVVHLNQMHYEATCPIPDDLPVKREKHVKKDPV